MNPTSALSPRLRWQASLTPAGMIKLKVSNEGNFHIHLTDLKLMESGGHRQIIDKNRVHAYMLPGKSLELTLKPEFDWKGERFRLSASTDRGVVDTELVLEEEKP